MTILLTLLQDPAEWAGRCAMQQRRMRPVCPFLFTPDLRPIADDKQVNEVDLWDGGITFHTLAIILGAVFAVIAWGVSFYLIMSHATHYSNALEQRQ